MRAIRLHEFGDPGVLGLEDVGEPEAGDGRVLIDVDAAGVNYGDVLVRRGEYMGRDALPVLPGWEVVGRLVEDGPLGRAGTRVVALLDGDGYAERVAAPAGDTVPVPDDISDAVALAMVIQGATAWHLLETPRPFTPGEHVVVTGAGSGVTHLVIQLARERGAGSVTVLASSGEKAALVTRIGADAVVRTDGGEDLRAAVREATGGGSDRVIDLVGAPLLDELMRTLRPGGQAVVYGVAGGRPSTVNTAALLRHGLTVAGLWLGHGGGEPLAATLERLFGLHRAGRLEPTLGPELALGEAAEAHRLVEARRAVGKVVLRVSDRTRT